MYVVKTKALISCMVTLQLSAPLYSHMQVAGFLMMPFIYVSLNMFHQQNKCSHLVLGK